MVKQASIASFFGPNATKTKKKPKPTKSSASTSPAAVAKEKKQEKGTTKVAPKKKVEVPPVSTVDVDLVDTDDDEEPEQITAASKRIRSKKNENLHNGESKAKAKSKRQKVSELNDDDDDDSDDDLNQAQNKEEDQDMKIKKDKDTDDAAMNCDDDDDHANDEDGDEDEDYKQEDQADKDDDDDDDDGDDDIGTDSRSDIDIAMDSDDDDFDEPLKALEKPKTKTKAKSGGKPKPKAAAKPTKKNANSNITPTESLIETPASKSWSQSAPAPYSTLCQTLTAIEAISSRLEIQQHLTDLFRICLLKNPSDLLTLVYLSSNSVAAAYECVELGIGDAILIKAVAEASGSNAQVIKKQYETVGDLGTVAMTAKGKQRTLGFGLKKIKPLTSDEVLKVFRQIANVAGSKSQKWKTDLIKGLLVRVQGKETKGKDGAGDNSESKYIIRGLQGKLRIGLAQSTVLTSLSHAVLLNCLEKEKEENADDKGSKSEKKEEDDDDEGSKIENKEEDDDDEGPKIENKENDDEVLSEDAKNVKNQKLAVETRLESAVNIVKKAYSEVSSFDALLDALLRAPLYRLNQECTLRPGMPVEPMLAKPTKSIQEVLKRLSGKRFTCEFKYDGERAQVHLSPDGVTNVFSRSLLDTSEKFPEVPLYVKEACENVESFVLDTEVVAYNRETKQFVPFQVLSTRKRTGESEETAKVKVIVQAFDLMYLNGKSLLDHTLAERRDLMKKHFKAVDGKFQFATALDHTEDGDTTMLEEFLDTAVKGQCEGLMVKTLDENASYQPSYRSLNWLKLKKDYLEGMGDSVDLVPIGAYHGRGKRTGVFGAYLLACYDVDTEEYQSVCKIGTGFSDEDLKTLSKGLNENVIKEKSSQYNVSQSLECDVWFDACQVWEVKAADLSKSSTHKGAIDKTGESGRGIGLRFPRFERLRDDKRPDQATSSDQILDMYYAQDSIVDDGNGYADDDGI